MKSRKKKTKSAKKTKTPVQRMAEAYLKTEQGKNEVAGLNKHFEENKWPLNYFILLEDSGLSGMPHVHETAMRLAKFKIKPTSHGLTLIKARRK